jgi:hypothetical protein
LADELRRIDGTVRRHRAHGRRRHDSCDGTAGGAACAHACAPGYEGGSITYTASDGTWAVDACTAITCAENEYDNNMVYTGCASGTTNAAGDDASGDDTACDQPCDAVEPTVGADMTPPAADSCDGTVGDAACAHACAVGYEGGSITCTSGAYAIVVCTATTCAENEYVSNMVSTGCASGTNAAGDDASGDDTACD